MTTKLSSIDQLQLAAAKLSEEEARISKKRSIDAINSNDAGTVNPDWYDSYYTTSSNSKPTTKVTEAAPKTRPPYHKPLKKTRKYTKPRTWQDNFVLLNAFREEHGHCNVPFYYEKDRCLGDWVSKQRKYRDNREMLSLDHRDLLDGIGFEWLSTQERTWNEKYDRLVKFEKLNGHTLVPSNFDDGAGSDLANWVAKQRQIYAQGRMTEDRINRLNSINFTWRLKQHTSRARDSTREDQKWMEKYHRLVAFEKQFGTCAVPFQYEKDKSLGRWVNEQRTQNTRGLLRDDRRALLNKINFLWSINRKPGSDSQGKKTARFNPLKKHKKNQQPSMPATLDKFPRRVSTSSSSSIATAATADETVTTAAMDSLSSAIRVRRADSISDEPPSVVMAPSLVPPDCNIISNNFDTMLQRLVNFKNQYGHVMVSTDYTALGLGPWLYSVKYQAREGTLDAAKSEKLRSLGVIMEGKDALWLDSFERLESFIQQYGHSQVSAWEDAELSVWVTAQRHLHKQGKLRADHTAKLDSIRFSWNRVSLNMKSSKDSSLAAEEEKSFASNCLLALANSWKVAK